MKNEDGGKLKKYEELAADIMQLVQSRLYMEYRLLGSAIALLRLRPNFDVAALSATGTLLSYNPLFVLAAWKAEPQTVYRSYMHSLLHCIFRHQFVSPGVDRALWDLASDAAVENLIMELSSPLLRCRGEDHQLELIDILKARGIPLTAESVFGYLKEAGIPREKIEEYDGYFHRDDHSMWYITPEMRLSENAADDDGDEEDGATEEDGFPVSAGSQDPWAGISESIEIALETNLQPDPEAESLTQNLLRLHRERYDYRTFLRKFAVYQEDMVVNDEEFDYVSYTFGLSRYGNMPLIEPLEYKESRRILDFVIAIDTSGSVRGDLVQRFINKTWDILSEEENFFREISLYIIQCDSVIQEEVRITNRQEFEEYVRHMRLKGFGSTDFRPVFERVQELIDDKAFHRLKGLIYFTDGYGRYPSLPTPYDTAFVYLGYDSRRPEPPPWVMKVIIDENQIREVP